MFLAGSVGSCAASALASCAAVCACEACKCVGGSVARASARAVYVIFFTLSMAVAWIMRDYAQPLMEKIPWIVHAVSGSALKPSDEWLGKQAVYRVTLGTAIFFLAMAFATAGVSFRNDPRDKHVQHGAWGFKTLLYLVSIVVPFFFPASVITAYSWVARFCGGFFLVLQMVILLDFTQVWNDSWATKENWQWLASLLAITLLNYAGSVVIMAFLYIYFVPMAACSLNTFFVVTATIFCVGFTAASMHPGIPTGSVFVSSVMTLYSFYLLFSAMSSEPSSYECNVFPSSNAGSGSGAGLAVGMSITLLSVVYSALRAGSSDIWGGSGSEEGDGTAFYNPVRDEEMPLVGPDTITADRSSANASAVDDYEPVSYNYSFFHVTFALAAMYVAMLMTGWSSTSDMQVNTVDVGWTSVWVKVCSQWFAGALYTWTLVAPLVMPDRDFA